MSDRQTAAFETTFRDLTGRYLDSVLACSACLPVALECYETDTEAFRTTRLDEETVVVFAGTESFVETASASGNVTISA